jgi:uncharacterized protein DUF6883
MTLPNADRAAIDPTKVLDYLLSQVHPVGRFKAAFFSGLGYSRDKWQVLRDDLLALVRTAPTALEKSSSFGRVFQVDGILTGPLGRSAHVRTVWIIGPMEDLPRFITAFPR